MSPSRTYAMKRIREQSEGTRRARIEACFDDLRLYAEHTPEIHAVAPSNSYVGNRKSHGAEDGHRNSTADSTRLGEQCVPMEATAQLRLYAFHTPVPTRNLCI